MNLPFRVGTKKIRVWDWPVRLFHWLVVLLFIVSWISAEIGGNAAAGVYALVTKL